MKRLKITILLLFQLTIFYACAQKKTFPGCDPTSSNQPVFINAEVMPQLKDSMVSLLDHFKEFFKSQTNEGKGRGTLAVKFFIDKNGKGCSFQIDNKSPLAIDPGKIKDILDAKLIWNPAMQNNHPVACYKFITINFTEVSLLPGNQIDLTLDN